MDLQGQWERVLVSLHEAIGPQDVEIWLRHARPLHLDEQRLLLQVPNRYYAEWISDNYLGEVRAQASQVWRRPVDVEFAYADDPTSEAARPSGPEAVAPLPPIPSSPRGIGINRSQTFDSFVVGGCNMFAHAAAQAVGDNPAKTYNPLYIYGGTGLGKTHLMHAIGNRILSEVPSSRIVYVTAEDFMNEMINSIRYKRMEEFRAKYRQGADVLLVDDIQFLSGKERTQEEFFFTFNTLQNSGRQIVLTSDLVPRDIKSLEPRLRTRFEGGLLADVHAPDVETLIAILRQKSDQHGVVIPPDLADAIAGAVQGNIRELEGILNHLGALTRFYNAPLSLALARKHMPKVFTPEPPVVTVSGLIEAVARFHDIRSADITGNKRTRALTRPRHIAMYLARTHTPHSFPELGREFGGRDHSTIQHGCRKVLAELKTNAELAYQIQLIEQALNIRPR